MWQTDSVRRSVVGAVAAIALVGAVVARAAGAFDDDAATIRLASSAFSQDQAIPARFTCDGEGVSPPISWSDVPADAKSLVLILEDPDAMDGVHWLIYDIPPARTGFGSDTAPADARVGLNDAGRRRYEAPCSRSLEATRYVFSIYALDRRLDLDEADAVRIRRAMAGRVLSQGTMVATHRAEID